MTRRVNNYQDLQDLVAAYLNRTDLSDRIQDFIYFGERKIFRWYRNQNNEKLFTLDMRVTPDPMDPTQLLLSSQLDLPDDYLETLTLQAFTWNSQQVPPPPLPETAIGLPLTRVSQTAFQQAAYLDNKSGQYRPGEPQIFARIRDAIQIYPAPEGDTYVTWQYYCDLSGILDTPTSDNNVLKTAPDMYVYAALIEAAPFLKTEDEVNRLATWKGLYEEAKMAIIEQNDAELYSGSNTEVQSAFGAGFGNGVGPYTNREGFA